MYMCQIHILIKYKKENIQSMRKLTIHNNILIILFARVHV